MATIEERQDTIAFILIKAQLGMARDLAERVSRLEGVHWAVVVTGPHDVLAAVRVGDNQALGDLVVGEIQSIEGVKNPMTLVMTQQFVPDVSEKGHRPFP
jgi:DNA-binding Lrp family transcriptional regulator